MREIKFRAWIARDGVMFSDGDLLADFFTWLDQWKDSKGPYVLMQFTGLTDRHGVDVFEGDIISDNVGIGFIEYSERYAGFRVNYGFGVCKWFYDYLDSEFSAMQIIGNIYQDKELVE